MNIRLLSLYALFIFSSTLYAPIKEAEFNTLRRAIQAKLKENINDYTNTQAESWEKYIADRIKLIRTTSPNSALVFETQMNKKIGDRLEALWKRGAPIVAGPAMPIEPIKIEEIEEPEILLIKLEALKDSTAAKDTLINLDFSEAKKIAKLLNEPQKSTIWADIEELSKEFNKEKKSETQTISEKIAEVKKYQEQMRKAQEELKVSPTEPKKRELKTITEHLAPLKQTTALQIQGTEEKLDRIAKKATLLPAAAERAVENQMHTTFEKFITMIDNATKRLQSKELTLDKYKELLLQNSKILQNEQKFYLTQEQKEKIDEKVNEIINDAEQRNLKKLNEDVAILTRQENETIKTRQKEIKQRRLEIEKRRADTVTKQIEKFRNEIEKLIRDGFSSKTINTSLDAGITLYSSEIEKITNTDIKNNLKETFDTAIKSLQTKLDDYQKELKDIESLVNKTKQKIEDELNKTPPDLKIIHNVRDSLASLSHTIANWPSFSLDQRQYIYKVYNSQLQELHKRISDFLTTTEHGTQAQEAETPEQ